VALDYVFVNDGANHRVIDSAGEHPTRFLLSSVTQEESALVTIAEDEAHRLGEGQYARFKEVGGMAPLNGNAHEVAEVISTRQFWIRCDTHEFPPYGGARRAGYGCQVYPARTVSHLPLAAALRDLAKFAEPFDWAAAGRDQQVVLAFLAAQQLPERPAAADALNGDLCLVEEPDEAPLRELARESPAVICPTCAAFGRLRGTRSCRGSRRRSIRSWRLLTSTQFPAPN
jgi:hypothetical protein